MFLFNLLRKPGEENDFFLDGTEHAASTTCR